MVRISVGHFVYTVGLVVAMLPLIGGLAFAIIDHYFARKQRFVNGLLDAAIAYLKSRDESKK